MFDYIIVGAGFAGSVLAEQIASQLGKRVLVIDRRKHIGGNCYDEKDSNGILLHRYGPHLFHTDNAHVFDYLSRFTQWEPYQHRVLASVDGRNVPIPFNFNTIDDLFPSELAARLIEKLLQHYEYNAKVPILELKQSPDEDLQFLADYVYEKIFLHYTAKQWGMKPEEMDGAVTARVPVFIGRDDRYFNDSFQAVPKEGYTRLFEKMLDHHNIKVMLNTDFKELCFLRDGKLFFMGHEFDGRLIYTGQIDELFDFEHGELPYRSVDLQFETVEREYYQAAATVNYPNDYRFTRITEFKHIHPVRSDKTTILKEYPQPYVRNENTPYYPVFTDENQAKFRTYEAHAKQFENIMMIGRLAEYKYFDMDDIVAHALDVFEKELR